MSLETLKVNFKDKQYSGQLFQEDGIVRLYNLGDGEFFREVPINEITIYFEDLNRLESPAKLTKRQIQRRRQRQNRHNKTKGGHRE